MKITLETPIEKTSTKTITELTVVRIVDMPSRKIVRALVKEVPSPLVLWKGEEYDAIGQWTDTDAQARIVELLSK